MATKRKFKAGDIVRRTPQAMRSMGYGHLKSPQGLVVGYQGRFVQIVWQDDPTGAPMGAAEAGIKLDKRATAQRATWAKGNPRLRNSAPRKRRRNSTVRVPPPRTRKRNPRGEVDEHAATELYYFIMSTGSLYPQLQAIRKNLATKMARGTYAHQRAAQAFKYLVDPAAKQYAREHAGGEREWNRIFSVATRGHLAYQLANEFRIAARLGEFDYLLPKKYQKKNPTYRKTTKRQRSAWSGRKRKPSTAWWRINVYGARGVKLGTYLGRGTKAEATANAKGKAGRKVRGRVIQRSVLSGPFQTKPVS
jgi:hypothetical protein